MKVITKSFATLVLLFLGAMFSWFFNFHILYPILIPDTEKYAVEGVPTNKLFYVFFEISSNTGYHPEPTNFYIFLAYGLGITFGTLLAYKLIWKTNLTLSKIDNAIN